MYLRLEPLLRQIDIQRPTQHRRSRDPSPSSARRADGAVPLSNMAFIADAAILLVCVWCQRPRIVVHVGLMVMLGKALL